MNQALWDRLLRIVIGIGLLSLAFIGPRTPWGWLGFIPLMTGLAGYCPLYHSCGFSTCRRDPPQGDAPKAT